MTTSPSTSLLDLISADISLNESFRREYVALARAALALEIGGSVAPPEEQSLRRLLQCAVNLAASSSVAHRTTALRIITYLMSVGGLHAEDYATFAPIVFERLANFPAVDLVASSYKTAKASGKPIALRVELLGRRIHNLAGDLAGRVVHLTDFQKRVWDALPGPAPVSISAPTSAGKSFVLQLYLVQRIHAREFKTVVYLVPTRALIAQVAETFAADLKRAGLADVSVATIPAVVPPGASAGIYVLTQERLQILLDEFPDIRPQVVVVDEAHSVEDGARGVLLHSMMERLRAVEPQPKFVFLSPFVGNPGLFRELLSIDAPAAEIIGDESPVVQSLISVSTNPRSPTAVTIDAVVDDVTIRLADAHEVGAELVSEERRLPILAWTFARGQPSIIYGSEPSACEKIADFVAGLDSLEREDGEANVIPPEGALDEKASAREDFAVFLREHVHKDYVLARLVEQGVVFHYGNLPTLVRKGAEQLFKVGAVTHLVCTSTLLQGINLPAKNLFLHKPTKGHEDREGIPLRAADFWNLAGRAGRLGMEFSGNVFMIDRAKWGEDPSVGARVRAVVPAARRVLQEQFPSFISFVGGTSAGERPPEIFESVFSKLLNDRRKGQLESRLVRLWPEMQGIAVRELDSALAMASARIDVPDDVLERHSGVSPFRQTDMLHYMRDRLEEKEPDYLIPIHPLQAGAWEPLSAVLRRVHKYFMGIGATGLATHHAVLCIQWMRGDSYAEMIREAYAYRAKKSKRGSPNLSSVIRDMFKVVEQDLRFRYVKFVRCYLDLLRVALKERGFQSYESKMPSIPLYLEVGACSDSMVALIGGGLSRTTAKVIADRLPTTNMDIGAIRRWMTKQRWETMGLRRVVLAEILAFLGG